MSYTDYVARAPALYREQLMRSLQRVDWDGDGHINLIEAINVRDRVAESGCSRCRCMWLSVHVAVGACGCRCLWLSVPVAVGACAVDSALRLASYQDIASFSMIN